MNRKEEAHLSSNGLLQVVFGSNPPVFSPENGRRSGRPRTVTKRGGKVRNQYWEKHSLREPKNGRSLPISCRRRHCSPEKWKGMEEWTKQRGRRRRKRWWRMKWRWPSSPPPMMASVVVLAQRGEKKRLKSGCVCVSEGDGGLFQSIKNSML